MSLISFHIKNIDPVIWQEAVACPFKIDQQVHIWQVKVSAYVPIIETLKELLNPAEITRANKYLRDSDRNRFIVSRSALRNVLGRYTGRLPADIEFKLSANQKPYIDAPVHFNLSDSADRVVIAIAASEVGIDVEYLKPGFSYDSIINSHFNIAEIAHIKEADSPNRFFQLWTRKEAILKATGVGLTEHLTSITALDGMNKMNGDLLSTQNNWELNTFLLTDDYPVTIAAATSASSYNFYNYSL